jgi:DNA-binding CsgD family transcriptional regulator
MNQQAYLDIATSRDRETFQRRLVEFADRMGFPLISAVLVIDRPSKAPQFISIGNIPSEYEASYSDPELSRNSPVLSRLKHLSHPFTYDQSMFVDHGVGHQWEHQAAFGFKCGVAMAMHMNNGRHFLLGVDRDEPLPTDDFQLTRMMADLQLLGAFAQETAVRLLTPMGEDFDEVPQLTPREVEILRWTSQGKSAQVVADILKIHRGTVNYHIQCAIKKLGVSGKHQAVTKAIQFGLL